MKEELNTLERDLDLLKQDLSGAQHSITQKVLGMIVKSKEEKYKRLKSEFDELRSKVRSDAEDLL